MISSPNLICSACGYEWHQGTFVTMTYTAPIIEFTTRCPGCKHLNAGEMELTPEELANLLYLS
jgi:hypothetical protein